MMNNLVPLTLPTGERKIGVYLTNESERKEISGGRAVRF